VAFVGNVTGDGIEDLLIGAYSAGPGYAYLHDCSRYQLLSPVGGETWNVGAEEGIAWVGAEPADVWLSIDGGNSYSLLHDDIGGDASNSLTLTVPHQPTRFAKVKLTPDDGSLTGQAESDSLFTIEVSISLLSLKAEPGQDGGILLSWNTDPGPEDLSGYRIDRSDLRGDTWQTVVALTRETSYMDRAGSPGMRYRLIAINGLGDEMLLGETTLAIRSALSAWPLPYRSGDLNITFTTFGGRGGGMGPAEVSVFDLNGRLVRNLVRGDYEAGLQATAWDGRDSSGRPVSSGVYFLRATSAGEEAHIKIVVAP
jgi:hypothetical protein